MTKILFPIALLLILAACKNENSKVNDGDSNTQAVGQAPPGSSTYSYEDVKAQALKEEDTYGRVKQSLVTLQDAFTKSEGKMPNRGKVTVFLDEHLTMQIKNEYKGDVYETNVNLKNLNPENGGMKLVPDLSEGDFPGLLVFTLEGKGKVEQYKNGKLISEDNQLEIYMPDRASIERITPAIVQALNVAHGKT
jgi:hypothetical protein